MAIKHWPEQERPREKLLTKGAPALSDAELLAIFLRVGTKGKTALDVARGLLTDFGSLRKVLLSPAETVTNVPGLGPAKYALLQAAVELGQRFLGEKLTQKTLLSTHADTERYLLAKLQHLEYEVFWGLFLDSQNQLIASEELARGSLNQSHVYPREVVKRALKHNAAAVILAHNHPSGIAHPSHADRELTHTLQQALALIDVEVHDHLVVGTQQCISILI